VLTDGRFTYNLPYRSKYLSMTILVHRKASLSTALDDGSTPKMQKWSMLHEISPRKKVGKCEFEKRVKTPMRQENKRFQTFARRVGLLGLPGCALVTAMMHNSLHWLSYPQRVTHKLSLLTYKCLQRRAPAYLNLPDSVYWIPLSRVGLGSDRLMTTSWWCREY